MKERINLYLRNTSEDMIFMVKFKFHHQEIHITANTHSK